MNRLKCHSHPDPVQRLVSALTAEEITQWLIECHGLAEDSRSIVEDNLRDQMRWHRLQGRLDRSKFLATLAKLWSLRLGVKRHYDKPNVK